MLKILPLNKGIPNLINKYSTIIPRLELELLLSHVFRCNRARLYMMDDVSIDKETEKLCDSLIKRRLSGEPLQYIIGFSEFMGWDFIVNKEVFIPRPETEILVREVISLALDAQSLLNRSLKILDLCTGCGNIAISLARLAGHVELVATDISQAALDAARQNSILHGVDEKIQFYKGNLFQALSFDKKYKFDIIVCNPPYIRSSEMLFLQREVMLEPQIALDGGVGGMEFYKRIARSSPRYLKKGGSLFFEIGLGGAQDVRGIFGAKDIFKVRDVKKDFNGIERVAWIDLL